MTVNEAMRYAIVNGGGTDVGESLAYAAFASGITFKIRGKPAMPVLSVEDAVNKWNRYRDAMMLQGEGSSGIGNGGIVREGKRIVARISYNGRVWI